MYKDGWITLLTLAGVVDVHGPRGDEVDGRGGGVGAVHVRDQPRQPELPLGVGVLLKGAKKCSLELSETGKIGDEMASARCLQKHNNKMLHREGELHKRKGGNTDPTCSLCFIS